MARIDFNLDTIPMADKLSSVKNHVSVTTAAVVTMQGAVIAAENAAADHVCDNVNKGFHTLIRSQISQKIARYKSDVEAGVLELNQQSIALNNIKGRMTRDYQMISSRYGKLFTGINASLRHQIYEIDKYAVSFVHNDISLHQKRVQQLLGAVPVNQTESVLLSQAIASSSTKQNGVKLIGSMRRFISNIHYQNYLTKSIVFKKSIDTHQEFYLPVVVAMTQAGEVSGLRYFLPQDEEMAVWKGFDQRVNSAVYNNSDAFVWEPLPQASQEKLTNEFKTLVVDSGVTQERVKKMMISLYESAGTINHLKG